LFFNVEIVFVLVIDYFLCHQVSGLTNNIDFLVHCSSHPGFSDNQATTAFFEENMTEILNQLSSGHTLFDVSHGVSPHCACGLVAVIAAARQSTSTQFLPWSTSTGDWRQFGTVKRTIDIVDGKKNKGVVIVDSHGDGLSFQLETVDDKQKRKHSQKVHASVKSIKEITVAKAKQKGTSVWEIALNVGNVRRNATVAIYSSSSSNSVVDGMY
jgi:acetyl/propionyl-CoA carboxylase alpha subunit